MNHNMITRDSSREEIRVYGNRRDLWGVDFRGIRDKRRPDGEQLPESERVGVVREVELDLSVVSFHTIPPLRSPSQKEPTKTHRNSPPIIPQNNPMPPSRLHPHPFPTCTHQRPQPHHPPAKPHSLRPGHQLPNSTLLILPLRIPLPLQRVQSIGEFLLCEAVPGCGRDDGGSGGCGVEKDFGFVEGLD